MDRIGKYEVLDVLGQGGMGMVYRARDPIIGRDVAVKVILDRAMDAPAVRDRFYREARSAGALSHENVMTIFDVGEADGRPFIVMELLDGQDLRHILNERPLPTLDARLDIGIQICHGLGYAHSRGVVHRDIKPENVRVTSTGRVKILDFGIARISSETRTQTQTQIGTPRYMSPEQIKGEALDQRTDIFSFGVLFYELLAGSNPFAGDHITTVIYKVLHEEPAPLRLLGPPPDASASRDLQPILWKCLAKSPQRRYGALGEVARDLQRVRTELRDAEAQGKQRSSFLGLFRRSTPSPPTPSYPAEPTATQSPRPPPFPAPPKPGVPSADATVALRPEDRTPTPPAGPPAEAETVALTPEALDAYEDRAERLAEDRNPPETPGAEAAAVEEPEATAPPLPVPEEAEPEALEPEGPMPETAEPLVGTPLVEEAAEAVPPEALLDEEPSETTFEALQPEPFEGTPPALADAGAETLAAFPEDFATEAFVPEDYVGDGAVAPSTSPDEPGAAAEEAIEEDDARVEDTPEAEGHRAPEEALAATMDLTTDLAETDLAEETTAFEAGVSPEPEPEPERGFTDATIAFQPDEAAPSPAGPGAGGSPLAAEPEAEADVTVAEPVERTARPPREREPRERRGKPARARDRGAAPSPPGVQEEKAARRLRLSSPVVLVGGVALLALVGAGVVLLNRAPATEPDAPPVVTPETPTDANAELAALQATAQQELDAMAAQRDSAEAAGVTDTPEYQQALARAQEAQEAFDRGGEEGFHHAAVAAREAAALFATARLAATAGAADADHAEQSALAARRAVYDHRTDRAIATTFRRAEDALAAGRRARDGGDFAGAVRAFGEAERGYRAAATTLAEQALEADVERLYTDAQRARDRALPHASAAYGVFTQAEERLAYGNRQRQQRSFRRAKGAYEQAIRLYNQVAAAPPPGPDASEAARHAAEEAARRCTAARNAVPAANTELPAYRRGQQFEAAAVAAQQQGDYQEAQQQYERARAAYVEAASTPPPHEEPPPPDDAPSADEEARAQVTAKVRALSAQVARYLETENLAALRSLNSSFGSWSGFFAIAEDISASSSYSILSVEGPRATAQVNFTLRFVNTTNEGRRDELPVSQRWTLERRGSDWQLVGVQ